MFVCQSCGAKRTKWEGVPEAFTTTVCPYCSVGCELDVWTKNGRVMGVRPSGEGAANRGQACVRGRFGLVEVVHATGRLKTPRRRLVRTSSPGRSVTHAAYEPR